MKARLLVLPALVLTCAVAAAQTPPPQPWTPKPGTQPPTSEKKGVSYVNGVPDTGQFLPDSAVLGRVDDRVIRVGDLRRGFFASYAEVRPKPDSAGAAQFLNSIINKDVLALTALKVGRPLTFEDRIELRSVRQQALSNAVFARLVKDPAFPTEDDIQHAYAQLGYELSLRHIVFANRDTAERVRADLIAGRIKWNDAFERYSVERGDPAPDGGLGWARLQMLDPVMGAAVFDVKVHDYSEPIEDAKGWNLVQVLEKRTIRKPPLSAVRLQLVNLVAPVKMAAQAEKVRSSIRKKIHMHYDDANIAWASSQFGVTAGILDEPGGARLNMHPRMPEFSDADTARVLASWDNGGRYTVGMFSMAYRALPFQNRKNVNDVRSFRYQLDTFALEPFMPELAMERGLGNDPIVKEYVNRKREELMVEHLYQDSVMTHVRPTRQDRLDYYNAHLGQFFSYQTAHYAVIHRWTRAGADSVVAALKAGADARAILHADSLQGGVVGAVREIHDNHTDRYQNLIFQEMHPGDVHVLGPYKDGDFEVIKLLDYSPGHQLSYDQVAEIVDESVQNTQAEAKLKQFLARWRPKYHIVARFDLLPRVKMTDPLLD